MSETDVALEGFGYNQAVAVATNKTLAATDCGTVQDVTATCTITLPATAVGDFFIVRVGKPGITVTVSPNASDNIRGNGFTAADDKDAIATNQPAGSFLKLVADGAAGQTVVGVRGTWTRQA